jgi:hypothetical protein
MNSPIVVGAMAAIVTADARLDLRSAERTTPSSHRPPPHRRHHNITPLNSSCW